MRLGDLIYLFTKYTGIKWLVDKGSKMLGIKDCGCNKRRDDLNDVELW